jgi:hypothetical protein
VVGAGTKRKCGHSQAAAAVPLPEPESLKQEFELEGGEELSVEERERALILGEDEALVDGGQIAHDEKAVKTLREKAVVEMSTRGINISASENMQVLALFPKVHYIFVILMRPWLIQ